jgi:hypothetical protein
MIRNDVVRNKKELTWLDGHAAVTDNVCDWCVGGIELRHPQDIIRCGGGGRGDVAVVWSNRHTRTRPLQVNLASWVAEWDSLVLGNGWSAVLVGDSGVQAGGITDFAGDERVASSSWLVDCLSDLGWAGLIEDGQGWEVLPRKAGLVCGTGADVWGKKRPSPRLRDAGLEPHWHGEEAVKLPEDHLLPTIR